MDGFINRWFLDPLYRGGYPEDVLAWVGRDAPEPAAGDLALSRRPVDFLGVNYYRREVIAADRDAGFLQASSVRMPGEHTEMGWEVYPTGLTELLARVHREYQPAALVITENGAAFADVLRGSPDGGETVADGRREAYLRAHLAAAHAAVQAGAPLRGYFVWSLMDNFEWAHGYSKRFGLAYVDYKTQRRIVKQSGRWFSRVARENAVGV
jgi:beta-glucosidase